MAAGQQGAEGEKWRRDHETEIAAVEQLGKAIRRFLAALAKPQKDAERDAVLLCVSIATVAAADVLGRDDLLDAKTNLSRVAAAEWETWLKTGTCDAAHLAGPARDYLAIVEVLEESRPPPACPPEC